MKGGQKEATINIMHLSQYAPYVSRNKYGGYHKTRNRGPAPYILMSDFFNIRDSLFTFEQQVVLVKTLNPNHHRNNPMHTEIDGHSGLQSNVADSRVWKKSKT